MKYHIQMTQLLFGCREYCWRYDESASHDVSRGAVPTVVRGAENDMPDTRALPIATRTTLYLRDNGPATVSDIAQALQVSRTSIENVLGVLTDSKTVIRTTTNRVGVG